MKLIGRKFILDHGKTLLAVSVYPKNLGGCKLLPQIKGDNGEIYDIYEILGQIVEKHVGSITDEGAKYLEGYSVDDIIEEDILTYSHAFWRRLKEIKK